MTDLDQIRRALSDLTDAVDAMLQRSTPIRNEYIKDHVDLCSAATLEILDRIVQAAASAGREAVDASKVFRDWCLLNRRKGRKTAPLSWLDRFAAVWTDRLAESTANSSPAPSVKAEANQDVAEAAAPAPARNRQFHESDLQRRIGRAAYESRVAIAMMKFRCGRFAAALAVHGMAVSAGEIRP